MLTEASIRSPLKPRSRPSSLASASIPTARNTQSRDRRESGSATSTERPLCLPAPPSREELRRRPLRQSSSPPSPCSVIGPRPAMPGVKIFQNIIELEKCAQRQRADGDAGGARYRPSAAQVRTHKGPWNCAQGPSIDRFELMRPTSGWAYGPQIRRRRCRGSRVRGQPVPTDNWCCRPASQ